MEHDYSIRTIIYYNDINNIKIISDLLGIYNGWFDNNFDERSKFKSDQDYHNDQLKEYKNLDKIIMKNGEWKIEEIHEYINRFNKCIKNAKGDLYSGNILKWGSKNNFNNINFDDIKNIIIKTEIEIFEN